MHAEIARVEESIDAISQELDEGKLKRGQKWGGANLVIVETQDEIQESNGFKSYRYVVTTHAREVSYILTKLYNAFTEEDLLDYLSKLEFCGRLGNIVNRFLRKNPDASALELCKAMVHEAYAIAEEMDEGEFTILFSDLGVAVYNDIFDELEFSEEDLCGEEDTVKFYKDLGVDFNE